MVIFLDTVTLTVDGDSRAARNVARLREEGLVPQSEAVENFLTALKGFAGNGEGISQGRVDWYSSHLRHLAHLFGDNFLSPSRQNVERVLGAINEGEARNPQGQPTGRPLSAWSRQNYRVVIKAFYKWLLGNGEEYPLAVRWVRTSMNHKRRIPKVLSEDELEALIKAVRNPRAKALFSLMADAGLRIGEALSLKVENVLFDQHGAAIEVSGKTGERYVRLFRSLPELAAWRAAHPNWADGEWVFPKLDGSGPLSWAMANKILKRAARKARLERRVHFHMLRHTAATRYAAMGVNESIMNAQMGWEQGSRMPKTYIDLAHEAVDNAILRAQGVEVEKGQGAPTLCPRCGAENSERAPWCWRCKAPVDVGEVLEEEAKMEALEKGLDTLAKLFVVANPHMADLIAALETPAFRKPLGATLDMRNPETGDRVKVPIAHLVSKQPSAGPEAEQGGKASVSQMLAKLLDEGPDEEGGEAPGKPQRRTAAARRKPAPAGPGEEGGGGQD